MFRASGTMAIGRKIYSGLQLIKTQGSLPDLVGAFEFVFQ